MNREPTVKGMVSLIRYDDGTEVFAEPVYVRTIDDQEFYTEGNQMIKTTTVTLTDAQIKMLATTSVVIVPATEILNYSGFPSKLFFPIKVYGVLDTREGAYGNVNDGTPILSWGSDLNNGVHFIAQGCTAQWGNSPLSLVPLNPSNDLFGALGLSTFGMLILEGSLRPDTISDNSISLSIFNSGDLTDGHPNNTLTIVVQYSEVSSAP